MLRWLSALALLLATPAFAQAPHLEGGRLIVDGKPFLILGGELGNSSATDRAWLKPHWQRLKALHLNTVLAPVTWEAIEPEEGKFDFSSLDWLVEDARANDMRLVLLWFGSWKNSMSTYVPAWVKRDGKRFLRSTGKDGQPQDILSVFGKATLDADARAFAAMMRNLKAIDGDRHTVLMVQVENEIGFLPTAREQGPLADAAFARWKGSEEGFTAHHYARWANAVAEAGKREYKLPMYVNGAQGRPGKLAGDYPSGGPLAHLMREWKDAAPAIDMLSPDIYFPNFAGIADGYVVPGNVLFVPEANQAGDPRAPANAMRVIGKHKAIGFSPFAIENIADKDRLGGFYAMLGQLTPALFAAKAQDGFSPVVNFDGVVDSGPQVASMGGYKLTANFVDPWTPKDKQEPAEHGAILIWLGGEDYLVAGSGVTFTFEPRVGLDLVEEGRFEDGKWIAGRRLNGDETHQGRHVRLPPGQFGIQKIRLYRY
jgi:beta-galactosidase GanA